MTLRHLFSAGLLVAAAFATAADKEVEDLLKAMRDTYKNVKTAKIVTKSQINTEMGKSDIIVETKFKNPNNKAHITIKGLPGMEKEMVIRTDGKKIKAEGTPMGDMEEEWSVDNMQRFPGNLETLNFWDWERQLSTGDGGNMKTSMFKIIKDEEWNGKKWTVLEETAQEQGVYVRYFIDPKTNFMWRTVVKQIGNDAETSQDIQVQSLETDVELDDTLFKINLP